MWLQAGVQENSVVRLRRKAPGGGCYAAPGWGVRKLSGSYEIGFQEGCYAAPGRNVGKLCGSSETESSRRRVLCGSRQEYRKIQWFIQDGKLQAESAMWLRAGVYKNSAVRMGWSVPSRGCYAAPGRSVRKLWGSSKTESSRRRVLYCSRQEYRKTQQFV